MFTLILKSVCSEYFPGDFSAYKKEKTAQKAKSKTKLDSFSLYYYYYPNLCTMFD